MNFNSMLLGKILMNRRKEFQISRNQLARYIGISATELARIERGERQIPNLVTLIKLCEILRIDFIDLLLETGFLDVKNSSYNSKRYKAVVQNIQESSFEIVAENDEIAMEKVEKLINNEKDYGIKIPGEKNDFTNIELEEIGENIEKNYSESNNYKKQELCEKCKYFCSYCE